MRAQGSYQTGAGCEPVFGCQVYRAPINCFVIFPWTSQTQVIVSQLANLGSMRSYDVPGRVNTVQAMRASLLARATTTLFGCMRPHRWSSHAPSRSRRRSRCNTHARAPWISRRRTYGLPRLLMPNNVGLPPVEYCFGT